MGPIDRAAELAALGHQGPLTAADVERAERALADDPDPRVRAAAVGSARPRRRRRRRPAGVRRRDRRSGPAVRRRGAELAPGPGRPTSRSPSALVAAPRRSRRHRGGGRGLGARRAGCARDRRRCGQRAGPGRRGAIVTRSHAKPRSRRSVRWAIPAGCPRCSSRAPTAPPSAGVPSSRSRRSPVPRSTRRWRVRSTTRTGKFVRPPRT